MTEQDREKWNLKYLKNKGNSDPSEILEKYIPLASRGNALDLACGNGKNSRKDMVYFKSDFRMICINCPLECRRVR